MASRTKFANRYTDDVGHPTFPSVINRILAFDLDGFQIPNYKNMNFWDLVLKTGFLTFAKNADNLHRDCKLQVLDRPALDAMWYYLLNQKALEFDARTIQGNDTNEKKLAFKKLLFIEAMTQRLTDKVNLYWLEKKALHPEIDIIDHPEGDLTDQRAGLVQRWGENIRDEADPEQDIYFRGLEQFERDQIREMYEEDDFGRKIGLQLRERQRQLRAREGEDDDMMDEGADDPAMGEDEEWQGCEDIEPNTEQLRGEVLAYRPKDDAMILD